MIDIKKLTQQKNELKEVWDYLALAAEFPDKQVRLWLLDYPKDMIESAFKVLAEKEGKVDEPVKYLARVLRNAKDQSMTPEEREVQISAMRSTVGKLGAAKRHAKEIAYIKDEFARVCNDLPEVCRSLPGDTGIGFGSVFDSVSGTGTVAVLDPEEKPAAAAPPVPHPAKKEKSGKATPEPKPETKTENNPAGASRSQAKQGKGKTGKPKTIKTAKGDQPMPEGFDSWPTVERTKWVMCDCQPMQSFDDWPLHRAACSSERKAKAAGAGVAEDELMIEPL